MKTKRITIRITEDQLKRLQKTVHREKLTISSLFRQIIDDKLNEIVVGDNCKKTNNK